MKQSIDAPLKLPKEKIFFQRIDFNSAYSTKAQSPNFYNLLWEFSSQFKKHEWIEICFEHNTNHTWHYMLDRKTSST